MDQHPPAAPARGGPSVGPHGRSSLYGRSPLYSRSFVLLLCSTVGMACGYATLLPVVPLWAARGGANEFVAGSTTGLFMVATVLTQLGTPWLSGRFGYRSTLAIGCVLLGLPAPLLALTPQAEPLLVLSAIRGVGFGLTTVCGSALIAELVPREAFGRGSGMYGVAVGLPQLAGLPAGVWMAQSWGYPVVFWACGILPLLGSVPAMLLPRLPVRRGDTGAAADPHADPPAGARTDGSTGTAGTATELPGASPVRLRDLCAPWLVLLAVSLGYGAVVTFVPMSVPTAVATLLAVGATALLGRWGSGLLGDRIAAAGHQLPAGVLSGLAGLVAIAVAALASVGWLAVLGGLLFGLGYGVIQNDSLVAMFCRVRPDRYGTASATWNVALDGGYGLGAMVIGAVASGGGFVAAFGVSSGVLAAALVPAIVVVRTTRRRAAGASKATEPVT